MINCERNIFSQDLTRPHTNHQGFIQLSTPGNTRSTKTSSKVLRTYHSSLKSLMPSSDQCTVPKPPKNRPCSFSDFDTRSCRVAFEVSYLARYSYFGSVLDEIDPMQAETSVSWSCKSAQPCIRLVADAAVYQVFLTSNQRNASSRTWPLGAW